MTLQGRMDRQEQGMQILAMSLKSIMFLFLYWDFRVQPGKVKSKTHKTKLKTHPGSKLVFLTSFENFLTECGYQA